MVFQEASIAGVQYSASSLQQSVAGTYSSFTNDTSTSREQEEPGDGDTGDNSDSIISPETEIQISDFLTALSVCHTVQVASDLGRGVSMVNVSNGCKSE